MPFDGQLRVVNGVWEFFESGFWNPVDLFFPEIAKALQQFVAVTVAEDDEQVLVDVGNRTMTFSDLFDHVRAGTFQGPEAITGGGRFREGEPTQGGAPAAQQPTGAEGQPQTKPSWWNERVEAVFGPWEQVGLTSNGTLFGELHKGTLNAARNYAEEVGIIPPEERRASLAQQINDEAVAFMEGGDRRRLNQLLAARDLADRPPEERRASLAQQINDEAVKVQEGDDPTRFYQLLAARKLADRPSGTAQIQQRTVDDEIGRLILAGDLDGALQLSDQQRFVRGENRLTRARAIDLATRFAQSADEFNRIMRTLNEPEPFGRQTVGPFSEPQEAVDRVTSLTTGEPIFLGDPEAAARPFPTGPAGLPSPQDAIDRVRAAAGQQLGVTEEGTPFLQEGGTGQATPGAPFNDIGLDSFQGVGVSPAQATSRAARGETAGQAPQVFNISGLTPQQIRETFAPDPEPRPARRRTEDSPFKRTVADIIQNRKRRRQNVTQSAQRAVFR